MGTRKVLGEMEETQASGKVFTKLQLGEYKWQTYSQVSARADCLGRGLREVGVKPRDNVVIYANTSADWMTCAIGAFRQSIALVTIYTNLGEEGVLHGVAQTEASVVIVGEDLLGKLLALLPDAPAVKSVIVIPSHNPDPLPSDTNTVFHLSLPPVLRRVLTVRHLALKTPPSSSTPPGVPGFPRESSSPMPT